MIRLLLISIAGLALIQCGAEVKSLGKSSRATLKPGDLYGKINRARLYEQDSVWSNNERAYQPDIQTMAELKQYDGHLSVEIFLGTWCPDSRREVPRFFKILDQAGLVGKIDIDLYAVDRKKKLENGLAGQRKIEFVPTFIFYNHGKEVGRIIESPYDLLEKDIQNILIQK